MRLSAAVRRLERPAARRDARPTPARPLAGRRAPMLLGLAASAVCLAAALTAVLAPASAAAAACVPTRNVELIEDDSQTMYGADPERSRLEAARLLLSRAANRGGLRYGAVEFGTRAATVFAPTPVTGASLGPLFGALWAHTNDDGSRVPYPLPEGGQRVDSGADTNLDAAFAEAARSNPGARARVLLSDGAHNDGAYANGHRRGPRTYAIGLGVGTRGGGATRLRRIAAETRGTYYPQADPGSPMRAAAAVDARLACATTTRTLRLAFTREERRQSATVRLRPSTRSIELAVLWQGRGDRFELPRVEVIDARGRTLAAAGAAAPQRLRVARLRGATYVTARVTGNGIRSGGRLRITVRAARLSGRRAPASVAVAESRSR